MGEIANIRTTMVGSWIQLRLPEELDKLFVDGLLIDPRTGTPMEMDGYSAYLALKAIEMKTGRNLEKERSRILEAVIRRFDDTEPPFSHGWFTGSNQEIHMRFTAAAVRLLGEAFVDGLLPTSGPLIRILRYHFSFCEGEGRTLFPVLGLHRAASIFLEPRLRNTSQ